MLTTQCYDFASIYFQISPSTELYICLYPIANQVQHDAMRKHGYSMRRIPLKKHTILVRGERVSAIIILSLSGIIDVSISKGTTNGDVFYDFVERVLLPNLQPFNGINPHNIVIMDNCSIHHIHEIVNMIE